MRPFLFVVALTKQMSSIPRALGPGIALSTCRKARTQQGKTWMGNRHFVYMYIQYIMCSLLSLNLKKKILLAINVSTPEILKNVTYFQLLQYNRVLEYPYRIKCNPCCLYVHLCISEFEKTNLSTHFYANVLRT